MTQNRSRAQQGWCWCCRLTGDTEVTRGDVLVGGASVQAGWSWRLAEVLRSGSLDAGFWLFTPWQLGKTIQRLIYLNRGWSQLLDCLWEYSVFHIITVFHFSFFKTNEGKIKMPMNKMAEQFPKIQIFFYPSGICWSFSRSFSFDALEFHPDASSTNAGREMKMMTQLRGRLKKNGCFCDFPKTPGCFQK